MLFGVPNPLCCTVDDINHALSIIRNIPKFPQFRVLKVMQEFTSPKNQSLGVSVAGFQSSVYEAFGLELFGVTCTEMGVSEARGP